MKAVKIISGILKAAILVVFSVTVAIGQSKSSGKNPHGKKQYLCKHVGKQKVKSRKFTKRNIEEYQAWNIRPVSVSIIDTTPKDAAIENGLLASNGSGAETDFEIANAESDTHLPLPNPVYFRFDTDELTYEDLNQMMLAIEHIKTGKTIILEGHTDSHGSEEYNLVLSHKRAVRIKKIMTDLSDINPDSISIQYHGESKPAAENDTHENRQLNRRVEFLVTK